jgi:hypothetical protein
MQAIYVPRTSGILWDVCYGSLLCLYVYMPGVNLYTTLTENAITKSLALAICSVGFDLLYIFYKFLYYRRYCCIDINTTAYPVRMGIPEVMCRINDNYDPSLDITMETQLFIFAACFYRAQTNWTIIPGIVINEAIVYVKKHIRVG